jgi:hypothetical protein
MPAVLGASSLLFAALISGRLAIVVSSSTADGQATLRYAGRDADRVGEVLRELGGFDATWALHEPGAAALRATFDRAERLARTDPHLEVVFYYSGHADGRGLLLGRESFPYEELRRMLESSSAVVRVAILDACQAGGAVRPKGGMPTTGFPLPQTNFARVQGAAILAASTATELAQESSEIEGSYFTHHMLSGLRGAADADGNGLVTLGEAYEYAYGRTVAATLPSLWGPQHPSFDYRLIGTGELVLTNLQRAGHALWLPPGKAVTYHVATVESGLVAEISAHPSRPSRLVLSPGRYRVIRRQDHLTSVADVNIRETDVRLVDGGFKEVSPELAFAKGRGPGFLNELFVDVALSGLGPGALSSSGEIGGGWFRRGLRWSYGPHVSYGRVEASTFGLDYQLSRLTVTAYGLRRVRLPFSELQLGFAAGFTAIRQTLAGEEHSGAGPVGLAVLALEVPVIDRLAIRLLWGAGAELLKLSDQYRVVPEVRAALALSWLF